MAFWLLGVLVVSIVAWLRNGRMLTLAIDRVNPFPGKSLPVSPLSYHGGEFVVGGERLPIAMRNHENAALQLATDTQHRAILSLGSDAFVLGPRTNPVNPNGPPIVDFIADPGDRLRLTARESPLGWPNPFEISWLGGSVPRWKKYVYYRLVWVKASGARLEMRWRLERDYYRRTGWTDPLMKWNWQTGLVAVEICPESKGAPGAIVRYVARTKGWNRSQYWIEPRGMSADGKSEIFAVIHLCDQCLAEPGAGGSVELYVDRSKEEVSRELGYQ